jgi:hypothetical protein
MRQSFIARQKKCGVYFSIMHAMMVSLNRIQTCLKICVIELVTSTCSLVAFQADDAQMPLCCASQAPACISMLLSWLGFMRSANRNNVMNDVGHTK